MHPLPIFCQEEFNKNNNGVLWSQNDIFSLFYFSFFPCRRSKRRTICTLYNLKQYIWTWISIRIFVIVFRLNGKYFLWSSSIWPVCTGTFISIYFMHSWSWRDNKQVLVLIASSMNTSLSKEIWQTSVKTEKTLFLECVEFDITINCVV